MGPRVVLGETLSEVPEELKYTKEHEWIRVEGGEVVIGITDFAQNALTDVVWVELPEDGANVSSMESFASVESVKSVSEIYAPVGGEVVGVNENLEDAPELINDDPYGDGWIIKMKLADASGINGLMSADDYRAEIGE